MQRVLPVSIRPEKRYEYASAADEGVSTSEFVRRACDAYIRTPALQRLIQQHLERQAIKGGVSKPATEKSCTPILCGRLSMLVSVQGNTQR